MKWTLSPIPWQGSAFFGLCMHTYEMECFKQNVMDKMVRG